MVKELICALVGITLAGPAAMAAQGKVTPQTKPAVATPAETKLITDFEARVKAYHDLRDKVDGGAARQTQTKEPEKIEAQKKALAANIQKARAGAKPGDMFTPETQPFFKRLLKPAIKGTDGAENTKAIKEDSPAPVTIKVNAPYPETQPLSTVPPDVLLQLPPLPKDLEYRFMQKHLILYDARASLIVDVIYNALP